MAVIQRFPPPTCDSRDTDSAATIHEHVDVVRGQSDGRWAEGRTRRRTVQGGRRGRRCGSSPSIRTVGDPIARQRFPNPTRPKTDPERPTAPTPLPLIVVVYNNSAANISSHPRFPLSSYHHADRCICTAYAVRQDLGRPRRVRTSQTES